MVICSLFLGATVYAYAISEEIRTASGRIFLLLVSSLLMAYVSYALLSFELFYSFKVFNDFLRSAGIVLAFLSYNVLAFDIFWTVLHFRKPSEIMNWFKFYCFYILVAMLVYILIALVMNFQWDPTDHTEKKFFATLAHCCIFGSIALDFIFNLATGYMIFKISKTLKISEYALFIADRDR
jgi:hypothetical protein